MVRGRSGHEAVLALALTVAIAAAVSWRAEAQRVDDPRALEVAGAVHAFYAQVSRMQVRFTQHQWTRAYGTTMSSAGRMAIERPGRLRLDYDTPPVFVSSAGRFTYFEPQEGSAGQVTRGTTDAAAAALGILDGTSVLARDFRFALRAGADGPADTDRLVLTPRRASPYASIVLYVSRAPETRGVIRRMAIESHAGDWNRFDFAGEQYGDSVQLPSFEVTVPDGAVELGGS
jgi:outer membrane lipoprotein carrier protein